MPSKLNCQQCFTISWFNFEVWLMLFSFSPMKHDWNFVNLPYQKKKLNYTAVGLCWSHSSCRGRFILGGCTAQRRSGLSEIINWWSLGGIKYSPCYKMVFAGGWGGEGGGAPALSDVKLRAAPLLQQELTRSLDWGCAALFSAISRQHSPLLSMNK